MGLSIIRSQRALAEFSDKATPSTADNYSTMIRFLYSLLFYLATPLLLMRLLLRSLKAPAYRRRIPERFGFFSTPDSFDSDKQTIWIHAVSVGETVAAAPLVKTLQAGLPEHQIYITTMTPTGSDRVRSLFADSVFHSYLPYDQPGAIRRFIRRVKPELLVLMETELWPNLIHGCAGHQVKMILANARLSEKSAAGYKRFAGTSKNILHKIDRIAAQTQPDAGRFVQLGANPERIKVTGSLKFYVNLQEAALPDNPVFQSAKASGRTVIVAASTRQGEEAKLLAAFRAVSDKHPRVLFILVPRHPERFDEVAQLCKDYDFSLQRRSANVALEADTQILLGDSMGEMLAYYSLAHIAFVGGSLVDTGGQNVLEPAALSLPIVVGPSRYNFAAICLQLEEAGGLHTVNNPEELANYLGELIEDPARRQARGTAARVLVEENQRALPELWEIIRSL